MACHCLFSDLGVSLLSGTLDETRVRLSLVLWLSDSYFFFRLSSSATTSLQGIIQKKLLYFPSVMRFVPDTTHLAIYSADIWPYPEV